MAPLESRDDALRLARAIVADIELYNGALLASGNDLGPELAEGRSLYHSRVAAPLHALFDEVVQERRLAKPSDGPWQRRRRKRSRAVAPGGSIETMGLSMPPIGRGHRKTHDLRWF